MTVLVSLTRGSFLVLAGFFIVTAVAGAAVVQESGKNNVLPHASITIGGPTRLVSGIPPSDGTTPQGTGDGDLLTPNLLTLRAPSGAVMTLQARSCSYITNAGVVTTVFVRRPLEPVRFQQAKTDLLQTLSQLHIRPDEQMTRQIAPWTEDVPGYGHGVIPYDWRTAIRTPFQGMLLDIQISPDPRGGWYYVLNFTRVEPDMLEAISPANPPTTQRAAADQPVSISARLLGSPADCAGIHRGVAQNGLFEVDEWRQQKITIRLPGGRAVPLETSDSSLFFYDGVLRAIFVRRPTNPTSFSEAKADLLRTLADVHVEPDKSMESMMSLWPKSAPNRAGQVHSYQATLGSQVDGATFSVRICPDTSGQWYYYIILGTRSTKPAHADRTGR